MPTRFETGMPKLSPLWKICIIGTVQAFFKTTANNLHRVFFCSRVSLCTRKMLLGEFLFCLPLLSFYGFLQRNWVNTPASLQRVWKVAKNATARKTALIFNF
jgi:hypothetical protein